MEAKTGAHKGETNQKELPGGEKTKLREITYIINSAEGLFNSSKRGTVASL